MRRVLAVSALAHLAIFGWLHAKPPAPALAITPPARADEIEIIPEGSPASTQPRAVAIAMATATQPAAAPAPRAAGAPTANALPIVEAAAETAPYASNGTLVVFAPNVALGGIGAANPFVQRGALAAAGITAPSASASAAASSDSFYVPENKRAEQAVKDALRARDASVGLGLEGPVVHALVDATHAGFAPEHGTATFLAVIDERGIVIDLKVLSSTASTGAGWEDVRVRAAKSLATAKIDLRGVKRAELRIEVQSDLRLASGSDPNAPVKPTGKQGRSTIETNAPGSPGGADTVQTFEAAQFDVTDIHKKKTRAVHAKLVMLTTR